MATDLGKVGMRMRGTWDSSTAYEVLDVVSYNNGLYIAKQAVPANTVPTNTTYWQKGVDSVSFTTTASATIIENCPTTLAYTGVSITIPAGANFGYTIGLTYYGSAPQEIMISTSDTAANNYNSIAYSNTIMQVCIAGRAASGTTYYIWGKWNATTSNNRVTVNGWYTNP